MKDSASWLRLQQEPNSHTKTCWGSDGTCHLSWWIDLPGEETQSGHGSGASFHDALRDAFKYGDPWSEQ